MEIGHKGRLAVAPWVTREVVGAALIKLRWVLQVIFEDDPEDPYEEIWSNRAETVAVHYIEDDILGANYLLIEAEGAAELTEVATLIGKRLDILSSADVVDWIRTAESTDEKLLAVAHLGASVDRPDVATIQQFDALLQDPDVAVRRAAVVAASYLKHPEIDRALQRTANDEEDAEIRFAAKHILTVEGRAAPTPGI